MANNPSLKDFQEWIKQTNQAIDDWTLWLAQKAKKEGKTYAGAVRWTKRNEPDLPRSFNGGPHENFSTAIRSMFEEAASSVRTEGLNRKCDKND
ncbi:hypothetical protein AO203_09660 [Lactobacillus gallinarum]|nr:hypothetical protein AO203_09660 [Lactobacillus gallinarum]